MNLGYKDSPLGKIPNDWEVIKLEEACIPKEGMRRGPFGGAIKKEFFVEKGYQVYEQRNAIYDDFVSARYFINDNKYKELKAFQIQANDFIISCSGTIGKIAKVPENYSKGIINQALLRLRLDRKKMHDDYFIQQFRDVPFQNKITDSVQGGAMKNLVGMSEFRKTLVTLPPLHEQQKIAKILSTVDDKIEVIEQQIIKTQELKKGLMQRLLTKGIGHTEFKNSPLGMIPESWEVVNVETFIQNKKGAMKIGPFGSALKKDTLVAKGIKVYGQENIFARDMSFGDRYITPEHFQSLKSCELFPGDFIISMMGTIGKCMVVPNNIERGLMDSHLLRLQLNLKIMDADFLKHLFRSPLVLNQVNNLAVGGIMAGLSSKIIKHINFILPTINEQKQFAEIFTCFDYKLDLLIEKKIHYQELKKGLMQQLLTGKIRVKV